jgi:preprotein translocase subunit SecG
MYTFLLVLLVVDSLILVAAVLLQSAKGGGLAASFGGVSTVADTFMGSRQAADFLQKLTWWTAGIFLGLAFGLQLMSAQVRAPRSILDQSLTQPAPVQPVAPEGKGAQPVVPLAPAEKSPAPSGAKKQ